MPKFFNNITEIDRFTRQLDQLSNNIVCTKCSKDDQFISHGYIYKALNQGKRIPVGKRILCATRYGRSGCGSTMRLYLKSTIPSLKYNTVHLFIFITELIANASISSAYSKATGAGNTRNAFRWLNKLKCKLIDYRQFLRVRGNVVKNEFKARVHRLQILLPTLKRLFSATNINACQDYQSLQQNNFI